MRNVLLEPVEYKMEETSFGTWKRYLSPAGQAYHEFTSYRLVMGMPFLHYTSGGNPETGRMKVARGFIAVGRLAVGVVAVGQASAGIVAVGQLSFGTVLGLGQLCAGLVALGQVSMGVLFGAGQVATGIVAMGQVAFGVYVLGQAGAGTHVWDANGVDEAARHLFKKLVPKL
jgi:hypothetical protein